MLPIYQVEKEIVSHLRAGRRLVLSAPTGSGKTTQVPQILLRQQVVRGQIIVLQPRRLAARVVAARVAAEMGSAVGQVVGYQTRHDSRISAGTVVRFMTEGLLLRLLQTEPSLPGVGAVILDEFHERSLAADTALAMVKSLQEHRRQDLKLVVMSATLDVQAISRYLDCASVEASGRLYPVDIHYLVKRSQAAPWELAADALLAILNDGTEGDVLIFMPGAYEIRRTIDECRRAVGGESLAFFPLYGELPPAEQDAALGPSRQRKVIVSTNVAETSITIEGIRYVIDSGLARIHRYDPRRGINVLLIEPISQSSAQQRTGRAGRTGPGVCYRLWPESEHRSRPGQDTPEVKRLDLAEVVLQLRSMGISDVGAFPWLERPEKLALEQAEEVLRRIGATEPGGTGMALSAVGKTMARLPMHPRLSRLLAEAGQRGCLERAALWAALISDRDILQRDGWKKLAQQDSEGPRSDFVTLERAYYAAQAVGFDPGRCAAMGIQGNACRDVEKTHRLYLEACRDAGIGGQRRNKSAGTSGHPKSRASSAGPDSLTDLLQCLLVAYPDHVAVRRGEGNLACALVGGRRGVLDQASVAKTASTLVAVEIREVGAGAGVKTILSLVSEIEPAWLGQAHPHLWRKQKRTLWNEQKMAVEEAEQLVFDDLVLEETWRPATDVAAAAEILADKVLRQELKLDGWDESVEQWIARTRCVAGWFGERKLIAYDANDLRVILEEFCTGATRYSQIKDKPLLPAVKNALSWEDQRFVEQMAPERIELPRGWRMKIEYQAGSPPRGRAKIQDFYDLKESPTVAGGRQRVLLEILGPNFRPVQTTEDLAGFWKNLYPTLRKELSRKYPRHEWR